MDSILSYERNSADDYYHILGCTETASTEQILAEFKAQVLVVHPDKNPGNSLAEEKFKKLQQAKETLVDPQMRKSYDTWRKSGIAMPFLHWLNLHKNIRTSFHWANPKSEGLMLEQHVESSTPTCADSGNVNRSGSPGNNCQPWQRSSANRLLRQFRNYEI